MKDNKAYAILQTMTALITPRDEDVIEEFVAKAYIAQRLKPLIGHYKITKPKLNDIIELFVELYLEEGYSLDLLINALYNYINFNGICPSVKYLSDDIVAFLQDYENE